MMAVNGKRGAAQVAEEQHCCACFRTDSGKRLKPRAGGGNVEVAQKIQRQLSAPLSDEPEDALDTRRFLFGPGAGFDCRFNLIDGSVADGRPILETGF